MRFYLNSFRVYRSTFAENSPAVNWNKTHLILLQLMVVNIFSEVIINLEIIFPGDYEILHLSIHIFYSFFLHFTKKKKKTFNPVLLFNFITCLIIYNFLYLVVFYYVIPSKIRFTEFK